MCCLEIEAGTNLQKCVILLKPPTSFENGSVTSGNPRLDDGVFGAPTNLK